MEGRQTAVRWTRVPIRTRVGWRRTGMTMPGQSRGQVSWVDEGVALFLGLADRLAPPQLPVEQPGPVRK